MVRQIAMHPVYQRYRDTPPCLPRELRLYNGLITLPHFREPLSRWRRRLLSNLTAHRRARRLGVQERLQPRDRTLRGRLAQRSFTCAFRFPFFFLSSFFLPKSSEYTGMYVPSSLLAILPMSHGLLRQILHEVIVFRVAHSCLLGKDQSDTFLEIYSLQK